MIEVCELPPEGAYEFYDELVPFVRDALAFDLYNTVTVEDIRRQIGEGYARVIVATDGKAIKAACVAQLYRNTRGERIFHVIACAGEESNQWLPQLVELLGDLAREWECEAVTMAGRPGWARKLAKLGFRTEQIAMRMNVLPATTAEEDNGGHREISAAIH